MDDSLEKHTSKVIIVEILKGKPYTCLALRPLKGKEVVRSENKEEYMFDISETNQIFITC